MMGVQFGPLSYEVLQYMVAQNKDLLERSPASCRSIRVMAFHIVSATSNRRVMPLSTSSASLTTLANLDVTYSRYI